MAQVQTVIRLIEVKETYKEVLNKMDSKFLELNELSLYTSNVIKITVNREFIVEVYP
jgi:hypothetical protein